MKDKLHSYQLLPSTEWLWLGNLEHTNYSFTAGTLHLLEQTTKYLQSLFSYPIKVFSRFKPIAIQSNTNNIFIHNLSRMIMVNINAALVFLRIFLHTCWILPSCSSSKPTQLLDQCRLLLFSFAPIRPIPVQSA